MLAAALLSLAMLAASGLISPDPTVSVVEAALVDLANQDRAANGIDPLAFDPETLSIARQRAGEQGSRSLSHYGADHRLAVQYDLFDAGLSFDLAGENLARTFDSSDLPDRVEAAFMGSPTHRQNVLEPRFTRVAIGAVKDDQGHITIAEIYR